jgi:hypothetical protein
MDRNVNFHATLAVNYGWIRRMFVAHPVEKKVKPLIFQYFSLNCCHSVPIFDEISVNFCRLYVLKNFPFDCWAKNSIWSCEFYEKTKCKQNCFIWKKASLFSQQSVCHALSIYYSLRWSPGNFYFSNVILGCFLNSQNLSVRFLYMTQDTYAAYISVYWDFLFA